MANIFQLFGTIFIDNAEANKNIDTTTKKAETSGSKVGAAFSSIAKGAAAIGTAVVGAAATLGTAAYKMATDTAAQADEIDKLSERTSINREELQRWMHACDQSGVASSSLTTAVKKMSKAVESDKTAETFKRIGLNAEELKKMSLEEQFDAITSALADMEDGAERNAIGAELLGGAYTEMLPLLNAGSKGIKDLKEEADALGIVMSETDVKAGVKLGDTIANVKSAFSGLKNNLANAIIPIVQAFADLIIGALPKVQKLMSDLTPVVVSLFNELMPPLFDFIDTVFPMLLSFIRQLIPVLQGILTSILPVIISLLQSLLPLFTSIIEQVLPVILDLIVQIVPIFAQIIQSILPVFIQLTEKLLPYVLQIVSSVLPAVISLINTLLPPILQITDQILPFLLSLIDTIMPLVVQIIDAVLPVLINLINTIVPPVLKIVNTVLPILLDLIKLILPLAVNIIQTVLPVLIELLNMLAPILEPILDILVKVTNAFKSMIDFIKNVFTGNWKGAWESVKNVFSNVWDSIKSGIKLPINTVIEGVNALIRGLNKISFSFPDWVPGLGGKKFGIDIPQISKLRVGMEYVPYDDFPALLHRGEKVLTASEAKEDRRQKEQKDGGRREMPVTITLNLNIDKFINNGESDIDALAEELMTRLNDKIKEKGAVFA